MNKKEFFYYTALSFDSVFKTQVIGWINLYHENEIPFIIVKQYSIKYLFKNSKIKNESVEIRKFYSGPLKCSFVLPDKNKFFRFINILFFTTPIFKSIVKRKQIVIQTRGLGYYPFYRFIKRIIPKRIHVIYDSRATIAEEYLYNNKSATKESKHYKYLFNHEKNMVEVADRVFCVSYNLIDYHIQNNSKCNRDKFFYYPGNADNTLFYYDQKERIEVREKHNLEDKMVFVYSGGLTMPWHIPELQFGFFKKLKAKIKNAYFLVLTHDISQAEKLAQKHNLTADSFSAHSIENKDVRRFLNASDMGLLLREDVPMNNVASPTKFTEYMLCGLPIIISPNVGDFSALIEKNNYGFIYLFEDSSKKIEMNVSKVKVNDNKFREEISEWANISYSKQSNLSNILEIYNNIFKD